MTDDPHREDKPAEILIVDDAPANLELLSDLLKERGYTVRAATSGKLALQAVRNAPPDIILLDIKMPEMNGYQVCAELKADEKLKDIPVIFLSSLGETADKVRAFTAGGVDYITKPVQLEEVEARVATQLALRRRGLQLRESYDKLLGLEKTRDSLVHMVVHDLRSPLTGIYAFLELIKESATGQLPAKLRGYIDDALKSARQMTGIVSDMLDTSRMEAGELKLSPEDCDLAGVVEESVAGLAALAGNRRIVFAPREKQPLIRADRDIVLRVIQNLLANALKFAPDAGVIRIAVVCAAGMARVSIHDDGPGIPPEYKKKIFEKFAQVELPAGRQKYSTGLGLAFCKLAVEAHGGRIGVDSEEGKGSTFWFELPEGGPPPRPETAALPREKT
ncbi:MAG TPA: hybrid sensor histidine kinase/response regulator [Elusimicrobia bacterium]|nr:hybrid sensor histidine kinase/response regulator [Elusimicrobiota bacterium]